ncbi:MAG TPA: glycosyltransferase family 39 protein [Solirubrobacteraceae bacterium]|nr:glycosyltransferase family 39 protein [Solirubrobacteraceae bacterium]
MRGSLGHLWERIVNRESTPPLSYLYEWLWTKVIGTSEFALRLPFALLGIALVPVVYAAARALAGRRAGLIAAALAACNPMLIWHAQDARSYTLLALFLAGTVWALATARPWWWAGLAVGAMATHHFAIFIVAPEAVWLVSTRGRGALRYVVPPAVALVPLAALALSQTGARQAWIAGVSLPIRMAQVPGGFVIGYQLERVISVVIGLPLIVVLVVALLRSWSVPRGRLVLALGVIGVALPVLAIAVGEDFLVQRNVIGSLVVLMIAAAIGFDRLRLGVPLAVAVCAAWVAIAVATADDPKYRREDWRGAVHAAANADALLIVPHSAWPVTLYYRPAGARVDRARVRSLAVLRMGQTTGTGCSIPPSPPAPGAPTSSVRGTCWQVDLRRWAAPRTIVAGEQTLIQ